jgi:hypothetical protein
MSLSTTSPSGVGRDSASVVPVIIDTILAEKGGKKATNKPNKPHKPRAKNPSCAFTSGLSSLDGRRTQMCVATSQNHHSEVMVKCNQW